MCDTAAKAYIRAIEISSQTRSSSPMGSTITAIDQLNAELLALPEGVGTSVTRANGG
jgi:hypothetical protein